MIVEGRHLTAREAARVYAETAFEESRNVAGFKPGQDGGGRFRLLGGTQWYTVQLAKDGWEVLAEMMR